MKEKFSLNYIIVSIEMFILIHLWMDDIILLENWLSISNF